MPDAEGDSIIFRSAYGSFPVPDDVTNTTIASDDRGPLSFDDVTWVCPRSTSSKTLSLHQLRHVADKQIRRLLRGSTNRKRSSSTRRLREAQSSLTQEPNSFAPHGYSQPAPALLSEGSTDSTVSIAPVPLPGSRTTDEHLHGGRTDSVATVPSTEDFSSNQVTARSFCEEELPKGVLEAGAQRHSPTQASVQQLHNQQQSISVEVLAADRSATLSSHRSSYVMSPALFDAVDHETSQPVSRQRPDDYGKAESHEVAVTESSALRKTEHSESQVTTLQQLASTPGRLSFGTTRCCQRVVSSPEQRSFVVDGAKRRNATPDHPPFVICEDAVGELMVSTPELDTQNNMKYRCPSSMYRTGTPGNWGPLTSASPNNTITITSRRRWQSAERLAFRRLSEPFEEINSPGYKQRISGWKEAMGALADAPDAHHVRINTGTTTADHDRKSALIQQPSEAADHVDETQCCFLNSSVKKLGKSMVGDGYRLIFNPATGAVEGVLRSDQVRKLLDSNITYRQFPLPNEQPLANPGPLDSSGIHDEGKRNEPIGQFRCSFSCKKTPGESYFKDVDQNSTEAFADVSRTNTSHRSCSEDSQCIVDSAASVANGVENVVSQTDKRLSDTSTNKAGSGQLSTGSSGQCGKNSSTETLLTMSYASPKFGAVDVYSDSPRSTAGASSNVRPEYRPAAADSQNGNGVIKEPQAAMRTFDRRYSSSLLEKQRTAPFPYPDSHWMTNTLSSGGDALAYEKLKSSASPGKWHQLSNAQCYPDDQAYNASNCILPPPKPFTRLPDQYKSVSANPRLDSLCLKPAGSCPFPDSETAGAILWHASSALYQYPAGGVARHSQYHESYAAFPSYYDDTNLLNRRLKQYDRRDVRDPLINIRWNHDRSSTESVGDRCLVKSASHSPIYSVTSGTCKGEYRPYQYFSSSVYPTMMRDPSSYVDAYKWEHCGHTRRYRDETVVYGRHRHLPSCLCLD